MVEQEFAAMKTVVEHLSELIRIPSVSALSNRPTVEYIEQVLHEAGWQTERMPYHDAANVEKLNLIAAPSTQSLHGPAELAFLCHTDTVPYAENWAKALVPFIADGMLYGCGACDVKGFLACLLTAITGDRPSRWIDGLRVVFTADEEIGCIGAARLLAENRIKPKRLIVGEPTSLHPARAGKGYCLAEITVFGEEAHSALPQHGRSAIYSAARFISAIEALAARLAQDTHPLFAPGYTTLNVGTIRGGTAKNIIPGECRFLVEWRPIPGQSPDTVPIALTEIAEELRRSDPRFRCKIRPLREQVGFETAEAASLVRRVEALTGRTAASIPFGSEASLFASIVDEVIVFGPGDMHTAHSDRECVPLSELDEAVTCLQSLMRSA
jgi:acetylornithine deacetylase